MNYTQTLDFLYNSLPQFQRVGAAAYKSGLGNTIALDDSLANPHLSYKTIHIAGTNGKGSTSQMIYQALREEGYSVGLYTSPHLVDFRERIVVDGEMISKGGVVDFVATNSEIIGELQPSFFEITVAMALWWFRECKVDYAVVEVGMGGLLDSTNIITPEVSVITNISKDHTQFLGKTLPEIASQKAGIIKEGVPVVVGESSEEYNEVFEREAAKKSTQITFADKEAPQPYTPYMQGNYQRLNAQTAYVALTTLGVSESAKQRGIERAKVRGRWEVISEKPQVICDTGHNEDGLRFVTSQLGEARGSGKLYFVLGVVNDKDLDSVLPLLPQDSYYLFTEAAIPRALPSEILYEKATAQGLRGERVESVESAYLRARELATESDTIFIGGSTFTVADFYVIHNS